MSDAPKKKTKKVLSSFSIILILLVLVSILTVAFNGWSITNNQGETFTIMGANLGQFMMAPAKGFVDAVDVSLFIFVIGGFLGIISKTEALNLGIAKLVKKMHGHELMLIPLLMAVFAVMGSTYGFCEETVGFYILVSATMMAAGFDALTGAAMVLLGAGVGCLGSTVNPFAPGIAASAATEAFKDLGINATINQGVIIGIGLALLVVSWAIASLFVIWYAKRVKGNMNASAMSERERKEAELTYGNDDVNDQDIIMTKRQKAVLVIFSLAFLVMTIGFVPWEDLNIHFFNMGHQEQVTDVKLTPENADQYIKLEPKNEGDQLQFNKEADNPVVYKSIDGNVEQTSVTHQGWSAFLTNKPLGEWYFAEATTWFLLLSIIVGVVGGLSEREIVDEFMNGAGGMMSVVMIVALSRGVSVVMSETGLSPYFLNMASHALEGTNSITFTIGSFFLFFIGSFLIPSTSGMASVAMPIMGPLATQLGMNPAVMVMIFTAASGVVNLFTPTSGAIMGGLALARVEYTTWLKFAFKIIAILTVSSLLILIAASLLIH